MTVKKRNTWPNVMFNYIMYLKDTSDFFKASYKIEKEMMYAYSSRDHNK